MISIQTMIRRLDFIVCGLLLLAMFIYDAPPWALALGLLVATRSPALSVYSSISRADSHQEAILRALSEDQRQ